MAFVAWPRTHCHVVSPLELLELLELLEVLELLELLELSGSFWNFWNFLELLELLELSGTPQIFWNFWNFLELSGTSGTSGVWVATAGLPSKASNQTLSTPFAPTPLTSPIDQNNFMVPSFTLTIQNK
jgi:hypothetical protein